MNCKICNGESRQVFNHKILNKYFVDYFKCENCDFIQTEDPYWLPEAYSNAIGEADIGLLKRNIDASVLIDVIIKLFFNTNGKFIDYGGGYGVLVRLLRDRGYDFYRQDIYCENIFAKGFDFSPTTNPLKSELIVTLEVFEHLGKPLDEIKHMLNLSDSIFFSTELQPHSNVNPSNWWYFLPETGQHVSLYSLKTLETVASHFQLNLYTNGYNFHLLTKKRINKYLFKKVFDSKFRFIYNRFFAKPNKSLLQKDFEKHLFIK